MPILPATPRALIFAAAFFFLGFGSACDSGDEMPNAGDAVSQIRIGGQTLFADGKPAPAIEVTYRLTLDGQQLFRASGEKCRAMPDHGTGAYAQAMTASEDGTFALEIPTPSIYATVIPTCSLGGLVISQIRSLRLVASVPAGPETCARYCAGRETGCEGSCIEGNRLIEATSSVSGEPLYEMLAAARGGAVSWAPKLVFSSLGPATSAIPGVDLVALAATTAMTNRISRETFAAQSCETGMSCLRGSGPRTLLRFNSAIANLGTEDLLLGTPAGNPLFHFDACHNHFHLEDVLLYELVHPGSGAVVTVDGERIVGRKTGFCMMDVGPALSGVASRGYQCENQGISAGWFDEYEASLECQFIDITGVPPGSYLLRMTVNPGRQLKESDLSNNVTELPVEVR
jgi:hypothetical protein